MAVFLYDLVEDMVVTKLQRVLKAKYHYDKIYCYWYLTWISQYVNEKLGQYIVNSVQSSCISRNMILVIEEQFESQKCTRLIN